MAARSTQQVVKRSWSTLLAPFLLLTLLLVNLGWEVLRKNVDPKLLREWPWKLTLLDLSTCVTLSGIAVALLVARVQLSHSMAPAISYSSSWVKSSAIRNSRRTIHVHNAGPGRAIIVDVKFRFYPLHEPPSTIKRFAGVWVEWEDLIRHLRLMDLERLRDIYILNLGQGASIPLTGRAIDGLELAAFNKKAIRKLAEFDVSLQIEDVLGDQHKRILRCLGNSTNVQYSRDSFSKRIPSLTLDVSNLLRWSRRYRRP